MAVGAQWKCLWRNYYAICWSMAQHETWLRRETQLRDEKRSENLQSWHSSDWTEEIEQDFATKTCCSVKNHQLIWKKFKIQVKKIIFDFHDFIKILKSFESLKFSKLKNFST